MANNKMLIDAMHPEETRVVTVHGSRVEEFDFEAANRRQLRGNIYLAKVTRVEPSLQAAFIEYGGNRHGFLAFSEIHPDYYQIPLADRQALLEDEARDAEEHREREERKPRRRTRGRRSEAKSAKTAETVTAEDEAGPVDVGSPSFETAIAAEADGVEVQAVDAADSAIPPLADEQAAQAGDTGADEADVVAAPPPASASDAADEGTQPAGETSDEPVAAAGPMLAAEGETASVKSDDRAEPETDDNSDEDDDDDSEDDEEDGDDDEDGDDEEDGEEDGEDAEPKIAQVGGDALAEIPERPRTYRRHYKIQEVIKRRQIILVQVVKEERGTKGAALTTYLSLAGRYSVLMPNTGRGGGISRKITSAADRKRLKEVAQDLEVPDGMGVILRTAGASRTKPEIKRDFEYLMRLWESVRELTLSSSAPALVYEEGSLIKRAIRDLYNKDLDEVLVAGDEAYREARDFMRMLMPGQSKVVQPYRDATPIFARYGVEQQLDAMFSTHVTLKSGGYLVINPTEALVSIDVNSGRSTREHDIEDTALRTNLEAAEEVARQLRLRDLAGLVVIDFIDMEEKRNNRAVEKKLNECLKDDRARIQVGRISPFGLLEMSRQRIRTGMLESSSLPCIHCGGSGYVRATASVALQILRSIEESLLKSTSHNLVLRTRTEVALYILNQKRAHLRELEVRFGVSVTIAADERLAATSAFQLDRGEPAVRTEGPVTGIRATAVMPELEEDEEEFEPEAEEAEGIEAASESADAPASRGDGEETAEGRSRRRRRRRRRGGRHETGEQDAGDQDAGENETAGDDEHQAGSESDEDAEGADAAVGEPATASAAAGEASEDEGAGRRRRRGRRGGRGRERGEGRERGASVGETDGAGSERAGSDEDAHPSEEIATVLQAEQPVSADIVEAVSAPGEGPDTGETTPPPVETVAIDLPISVAPESVSPTEAPASSAKSEDTVQEPAKFEPRPEPVAVVLTPADPDRPKRAGWWSRTKAALTGE
ncbi:Rne/Rng family ribonuclease [Methylobacterium sp. Leaf466]|uniref:Rne/Rng family ribonuclease n=1 Tax=Methylobacterium sp. Leaf466 TaxID=1736386 RepID=UPI0006FB7B62|nr:Rne/Rng family ribonuclease [Methylobacterium sp. Leaf466]KQT78839.1 ribonuclease [Methylobacterium sp. Leaf466]